MVKMKDYFIRKGKNESLIGMTSAEIEDRFGVTIGYISIPKSAGGCPFNAHYYDLVDGSRISIIGEEDKIKKFEGEMNLTSEK